LIGPQLPRILHVLFGQSLKPLVWHGALISCAVIVVRIAWVFASTYLLRLVTLVFQGLGLKVFSAVFPFL
jgi:hypothetical protein